MQINRISNNQSFKSLYANVSNAKGEHRDFVYSIASNRNIFSNDTIEKLDKKGIDIYIKPTPHGSTWVELRTDTGYYTPLVRDNKGEPIRTVVFSTTKDSMKRIKDFAKQCRELAK